MRQKALRRAACAGVLLSASALLLSNGLVGGTFAFFNGETSNVSSTFAGGWVDAPTALTATPSGYDINLAWTPGTHGPVTGQQVTGVDNGTNSNCTGAAYSAIATLASASTAAYADASRGTLANDGHWFCYQVVSTSATVWTSQLPVALQLGLVTSGIAITNVATAGSIANTDKIILTFNQRTNKPTATTTAKVCVFTNKIILGDTSGAACATGDAFNIGVITGLTIGAARTFATSSFVTTTVAPFTLTLTLAGGTATTSTGTATFTPSASILSNATTHQATMCTTATTTCAPTTTNQF